MSTPPDPATQEVRFEEVVALYRQALEAGRAPDREQYIRSFPELASRLRHYFADLDFFEGLTARPVATRPEEPRSLVPAGRLAPGTRLRGFVVLAYLGGGGMGDVYRAQQIGTNRLVALKTIRGLASPRQEARFKQEFRQLVDVTHPNLISLHELFWDSQPWFFTMELVEGVSFLEHVRPNRLAGPLSAERVQVLRQALRQLATGVAALHQAGKLHRDLKPNNVLVTRPEGRVVILDFGLATELDRDGQYQSSADRLLGTIPYMAPEQAACQAVSPASDWYSVGVILYEALTGRLPFTGLPLQILQDKQTLEPPPPRSLTLGVPVDLDALCADLLRRDPAARPSGPDVLRRLGHAPEPGAAVHSPRAAPAFLIGRQRHLAFLDQAYRDTRQGRAVRVYLRGGSGAGKTTLVQAFLDRLHEGGEAVVLAGRCYESESGPYKAVDTLMEALAKFLKRLDRLEVEVYLPLDVASLVRIFPSLGQIQAVAEAVRAPAHVPDPRELRRQAFAALRDLLARLGRRKPLVLAIDDLQWGDLDSAALLAELFRPPQPPVLLFLGSYRSEDEKRPFLQALLRSPEVVSDKGLVPDQQTELRLLDVEKLSPDEARELALELLEPSDGDRLARAEDIARESGGNPFFVHELAQALRTGQLAQGLGEIRLDQVLRARVQRFPAEAQRLLEVVAVASLPLGEVEAGQAAEAGDREQSLVAALRSARLLRGTGPTENAELEIYHDRIREAILAGLSPEEQRAHHRRLALVLEEKGRVDPEVLAGHFQRADLPARASVHWSRAADQAAAPLAFDRAVRLYRLALEALAAIGADSGDRTQLRIKLANALANAGRGAEAGAEYLALAADAGTAEAIEWRRRAALQFLISGQVDRGLATLRTVLEAVGLKLPATPWQGLLSLLTARCRLWFGGLRFRERPAEVIPEEELKRIDICWSAGIGLWVIDPVPGCAFLTRSLLRALRAGEPDRIARGLACNAVYISMRGSPNRERTQKLLTDAADLARRTGHPHSRGVAALAEGLAAHYLGDWKTSLSHLRNAEDIFRRECTEVWWELFTAQLFSLYAYTFVDPAGLRQRVQVVVKEASDRGDTYAALHANAYALPYILLWDDDPDGARQEVNRWIEQWPRQRFFIQHFHALLTQIMIDLYTGNGPAAWERVSHSWPDLKRSQLLRIQVIRVWIRQMRAGSALAAALGTPSKKEFWRAAWRDACRQEKERVPWAMGLARLIKGGVAAGQGDRASAVVWLREAATLLDQAPLALWAQGARLRLGQVSGDKEGIEQAQRWFKEQGIKNPAGVANLVAPGFPG